MAAAPSGLLALSLALCLLCKAKALRISQKTPEASDQIGEASGYYEHEGHLCKMCPAGQYAFGGCNITGTESVCRPCPNGSFTTHMNGFRACAPCKICRPLDEVELKSCTGTSDTHCACKEGTFCSPDQPCETCRKCRLRCPDGEKIEKNCTPQSDIQCRPVQVTSPPPSSGNSNSKTLIWTLTVCGIFVAIIVGIIIFRKNPKCCFRGHMTTNRANSIHSKESKDNERNTEVDQTSQPSQRRHPGPRAARQPEETIPLQQEECSIYVAEGRRKLIPVGGKDPSDALPLSFFTIVEEVPVGKWQPYMMVLGLTLNEIDIVRENFKRNVTEQHFQMLRKWQEKNGKGASLDTLLETLGDPTVNLKGVEVKIRKVLISRGLYAYEE